MSQSLFPIPLAEIDYREHARNYDGLCSLCGVWKPEGALLDETCGYCPECENKSVVGMRIAIRRALVVLQ